MVDHLKSDSFSTSGMVKTIKVLPYDQHPPRAFVHPTTKTLSRCLRALYLHSSCQRVTF